MIFAKRVFTIAGITGLLALLPQYFLEQWIGRDQPPAITHPEFFYGFIGVAAAWQLAFFVIARDPARFRPIMPVAVIEKASFGFAAVALYALGRLNTQMFAAGLLDLVLGALFVVAYLRTATVEQASPGSRPSA